MSNCKEIPKCWKCREEFHPKPSFAWLCTKCNKESDKKECQKCRCKPFKLMPVGEEDVCIPCYCGWILSEFI
ncbi:hypothetical protein A9K97_gp399 [Tokyovirus A1]|uniref:hypothetical protein n=1 Tax=Tokyovirus A1 TaxID=1826170 RepID=UPI0007A9738C|nr:hypothetical protein A9K97_gp399 [Tokyovirus A1]BAU79952.1 hypothetical protein [Tokyovirus A1]